MPAPGLSQQLSGSGTGTWPCLTGPGLPQKDTFLCGGKVCPFL